MAASISIIAGVALTVSALALVFSAISDIRAYEIPNWASIAVSVSYIVFASLTPTAPRLGAFFVCLAVLIFGLVMFARGWMGGGDVKLLAAVSLWCGPGLLAPFAIVTGLSGAVLAALMLTPLRRLMPPAPAAIATSAGSAALAQPMPFGVAIAVGGAWVLAQQSSLVR